MVLCIWCPSTYIALKGRDGHRYSHAPQPMQRSVFMTGIRNESLSPGSMATSVSLRGGNACTVAAMYFVGYYHTVFSYPYGMPYLYGGFIGTGDPVHGSGRTDIRAFCTLRAAIPRVRMTYGAA